MTKPAATPAHAALGQCLNASVTCSKLVTEADVLGFAAITGDHSPNHVDEEAMRNTAYGGRIAHGALLVGYMSRASTLIVDRCGALAKTHFPVSLGYDRVRFLKGVRIGEELGITYSINGVDDEKMRTIAQISMTDTSGHTVAVATHVMVWLLR